MQASQVRTPTDLTRGRNLQTQRLCDELTCQQNILAGCALTLAAGMC